MPPSTLLSRPDEETRVAPVAPVAAGGDLLPVFLAGDIILFSARDDWYGRLSRWLMRTSGEGPTYAVHTAQFLGPGRYLELDIVGKIRALGALLQQHQAHDLWQRRGFAVWRCLSLTSAQRAAVTRQALAYVGARFGMAKFGTHLLDGLISKARGRDVFFFRRLNHDQRYPICSWITAFSYDRALHYQFGVPPECADPDAIADWLSAHPAEWVCVFRLEDYTARRRAGGL
jgi:hypothetical protein